MGGASWRPGRRLGRPHQPPRRPSASHAASALMGPCAAGPIRGYRAPAIAAAMATMEGCRAAARAFARSLGSAMATGAVAGRCGRRGRAPWVNGVLHWCWLCAGCSCVSAGRQCVAQPAENDHRILHSVGNTTTA